MTSKAKWEAATWAAEWCLCLAGSAVAYVLVGGWRGIVVLLVGAFTGSAYGVVKPAMETWRLRRLAKQLEREHRNEVRP